MSMSRKTNKYSLSWCAVLSPSATPATKPEALRAIRFNRVAILRSRNRRRSPPGGRWADLPVAGRAAGQVSVAPRASRRCAVSVTPDCRAASGWHIPFRTNHGVGARHQQWHNVIIRARSAGGCQDEPVAVRRGEPFLHLIGNLGAEMSVHVLAYHRKRAIAILGIRPLMAAVQPPPLRLVAFVVRSQSPTLARSHTPSVTNRYPRFPRRADFPDRVVTAHSCSIAATWSRRRMRAYIFIALSRL